MRHFGFFIMLAFAIGFVPTAKADLLFQGSQSGLCCFDVQLHQVDADTVSVLVSLTQGAQFFVNSGSPPPPNHPGFALNINGSVAATMTMVNSPWTSTAYSSTVTANNTGGGVFTSWILNPGNGANLANTGPLSFTLNRSGGLSISDFVQNPAPNNNYFAADILDKSGATGMSFISAAGVSVPDGGVTLMLLGGAMFCLESLRRRIRG